MFEMLASFHNKNSNFERQVLYLRKKLLTLLAVTSLFSSLAVGSVGASGFDEVAPQAGEVLLNPTESNNYKVLTEEEFIQRKAELSGRSVSEIRKEESNKVGIQSTSNEYREYYYLIHLGGSIYAKAGVLTTVTRFQFSSSVYYRFKEVHEDSAYLSPYSGGTFTINKNYVQPILEDDRNLVIAVSGYAETAVTNGRSQGLSLSGGELVQIGWSGSSSTETTYYSRRHFNVSDKITLP